MDEAAKKTQLRSVPYGLYVGCTRGDDGDHAFLLSWFTQTSFKPPMVAIGVHRESRAYTHLTEGEPGVIAVSLLGDDQQPFATEVLKGKAIDGDAIAGRPAKRGANGCIVVPDCLGALELEVLEETRAGGDHALFVCKVTEAHAFRDGSILTHEKTGWHYGG